MNRIARTAALILLPVAAGAVALSAAGAAGATTPPLGPKGPIIVNPTVTPQPPKPGPTDFAPNPVDPPTPGPVGPTDLAPNPVDPGPGDGPDDLAPNPVPDPDSGDGGDGGDGGQPAAEDEPTQGQAPAEPPAAPTAAPSKAEAGVVGSTEDAATVEQASVPSAVLGVIGAAALGAVALILFLVAKRRRRDA